MPTIDADRHRPGDRHPAHDSPLVAVIINCLVLRRAIVPDHHIALGYDVFPRERQTPEALGALVKADAKKWWPIIKEFGINAE